MNSQIYYKHIKKRCDYEKWIIFLSIIVYEYRSDGSVWFRSSSCFFYCCERIIIAAMRRARIRAELFCIIVGEYTVGAIKK